MVTLKVSITEQDFSYFYREMVRHKKKEIPQETSTSIMVFVLFVLIFLLLYQNKLFWQIKFILISLLVTFLFMFFISTWYPAIFFLKRNGTLKQILEKLQKQTIVFNDTEIEQSLQDWSKSTIPYSAFTKIYTTKNAIYLFTSKISAVVIPLSAFKNDADLEFVKSKLSSNTK